MTARAMLFRSGSWQPVFGGGSAVFPIVGDRSGLNDQYGLYKPSYATGATGTTGGAGTTGVWAGYTRTTMPNTHVGNWTITEAVASTLPTINGFRTITGYLITGKVQIQASNIAIINNWIEGPAVPGNSNQALIECNNSLCVNAWITDNTLIPLVPTYGWNAIQGHHFTALRNYSKWCVDFYRIYNANAGQGSADTAVLIGANVWEDHSYFFNDPNHPSDNRTHNDGVQVEGGSGSRIIGNLSVSRCAGYTDPHTSEVHPLWPGANAAVSDPQDSTINVWAPYWTTHGGSTYGQYGWSPATSGLQIVQNVGQVTNMEVRNNWQMSGATQFNSSNGGSVPPPVSPQNNLGAWNNNQFDTEGGTAAGVYQIAYGVNYTLTATGNTILGTGAAARVKTQTS